VTEIKAGELLQNPLAFDVYHWLLQMRGQSSLLGNRMDAFVRTPLCVVQDHCCILVLQSYNTPAVEGSECRHWQVIAGLLPSHLGIAEELT